MLRACVEVESLSLSSSEELVVVMRRDDRSLPEDGEIVETRPSAKVVAYASSDRVMVTTSPLDNVARNTPAPSDTELELGLRLALEDIVELSLSRTLLA